MKRGVEVLGEAKAMTYANVEDDVPARELRGTLTRFYVGDRCPLYDWEYMIDGVSINDDTIVMLTDKPKPTKPKAKGKPKGTAKPKAKGKGSRKPKGKGSRKR